MERLTHFIPPILAESITRRTEAAIRAYYDSLTPEEKEKARQWAKRKNHYLKKVEWAKLHPKKHKRSVG